MKARKYLLSGGMSVLMVFLPGVVSAATQTLPFAVSGVPTGGYPDFNFPTVNIKLQRSGADFKLEANYTSTGPTDKISLRFSPTQSFDVYNPTFAFTAYLTASGLLDAARANTFSITGNVPDCGTGCNGTAGTETLLQGTLANYGADKVPDASPVALGFTIQGQGANGGFDLKKGDGWASQFNAFTPESIYLYNLPITSFINSFNSGGFYKNSWSGSAVTTVPIPAAAWLFGSAVAVLSAIRRKKVSSQA